MTTGRYATEHVEVNPLIAVVAVMATATLGMFIHEMAHAVAAAVLRIRLRAVQFGEGPVRLRWRVAGTEWRIAGWLWGGHVEACLPTGRAARARYMSMIAAGPVSDLVLASLFTWLCGKAFAGGADENARTLALPWMAAVTVGLWLHFFDAAFRRTAEVDGDEELTDLGILIELGRMSDAKYVYSATLLRARDRVARITGRAEVELHDYEVLAGCPMLAELDVSQLEWLRSLPPGDRRRRDGLDELCTRALLSGDRSSMERALPLSAELHQEWPDEWTVIGTRGSILLVSGNVTEGLVLLESVMTHSAAAYDRAIAACCLAWAAHRRGDCVARDRWWRESLANERGRPAVRWMAREMGFIGAFGNVGVSNPTSID